MRTLTGGVPESGGFRHIAAYFDELEIGKWLLDRGMNPDARSAIDADGFGGYTALFSTVVSQRNFWVNYGKGSPTTLALRASCWIATDS